MRGIRGALALAWQAAPYGVILRAVLTAALAVLPVAAAWSTKIVLDRLSAPSPGPAGQLLAPVALLATCGVMGALLPQVQRYVEAESSRATNLFLRVRLFSALGRLKGLGRVEDPRFHDRLQMAGQGGLGQVVSQVMGLSQGLIIVAGFVGTLTVLNPVMTAVVLLAAAPVVRAELVMGRRRAQVMWDLSPTVRREVFYADLLTNPTAAKEIRLFDLGELFGRRMADEIRAINRQERALDGRELRVQSALMVVGAVVAGAGLGWAVLAAHSGRLTVGDVSVLVAAMAGVQGGLRAVIQNLGQMHQELLILDHYCAVVDAEPDLAIAVPGRPVPDLREGIELRDVWFRYGDDHPWVLRGVSFTITAGASTALVGLNGAGKSTIVKLLCRLYDPTRGAILWDGVDLREFDVDELRGRIGTVFQDFMQYELSAAENIAVGDAAILDDRSRIEAASAYAGIDPMIRALPDSYDTMLTRMFSSNSDRDDPGTGVLLSGGQWQRVAVARGLMRRDRALLILDEPSSGLDAEAEHEIHARLRTLRRGRTSILISHRLSTVRDADSIVVLSDGVIAECGAHGELMVEQGGYARLFTLQASGYHDEPRP
ncbi:ABC transporter ATP-binding protein [Nonomuraea sp. NPDC050556]|uniref:ABC transporter ATP-binding protein n=1 Tax=Nonomuraea sp. NPDC050556 TaxID=3364369 RepID=UPI0037A00559